MKIGILYFVVILCVVSGGYAIDNGLARTPPMGWNSWNTFRMEINENLVKEIADAFVTLGLKEAGYEYIVIDDGWQLARDSLGNIMPDESKFPSGIKNLADYIHSKGLKFGLYSDAGTKTCGGLPGASDPLGNFCRGRPGGGALHQPGVYPGRRGAGYPDAQTVR